MDFKRVFLNSSKDNSKFHPSQVREFSLRELRDATDGFSKQHILGRGGFGEVYRGYLNDGSMVAIKRLLKEKKTAEGEQQFQREVEMIGLALHRNLLKLLGFCMASKERLLVYPYMRNGSVAARLKGRRGSLFPLDWPTRLRVAYGTAKALSYLHDQCQPRIIHRDIKADNILLDEDYEAIVADFGLVKLMNFKKSHATTGLCGTVGHIAPEYFTSFRCSEKTDVYSYGMFLLELLTGRRVGKIVPNSKIEEVTLFDWVTEVLENADMRSLVDSDLQGDYASHEAKEILNVALLCIKHSPKERPFMSKVVRMLEDSGLSTAASVKTTTGRAHIECFPFSVLEIATSHFSKNNVIGRYSFGKIYRGILQNGEIVAVKRLEKCSQKGELQFQEDLSGMKNEIMHPNLFQLLGWCTSRKERIIVHPYMERGSLAAYLKGSPKSTQFNSIMQKRIAVGVARGLTFLHEKSIIHDDISSENLLLDENFNAIVGSIGQCHHVGSPPAKAIRATPGYIAPEYLQTQKFSLETDVFAYGVVILELLTGWRASDFYQVSINHERKLFHHRNMLVNVIRMSLRLFGYVKLYDHDLLPSEATTRKLLQLALLCTQGVDGKRPAMSKVIGVLEDDHWKDDCVFWTDVMKEVEFRKSIGLKDMKKEEQEILYDICTEAFPCPENWTADDKERMDALKNWISTAWMDDSYYADSFGLSMRRISGGF